MARQLPKVYYGLHMAEGVAEYREPHKDPYRILIVENALKAMDPTYAGKPVYVQHVDEVNLDNIQNEADGYVLKSFFNPADGKHWVEFIVVSDEGHEAVRRGWKLSNSYIPQSMTDGGQWHGVDYAKEITAGEYEHLAIVPNPRYTESVIMTPEEFKRYNEEKKDELVRLTNAKEEKKEMNLSFFKRTKVENGADFTGMSVVLPKSKKEITIEKLVNDADKMEVDENKGMADLSHKVKLHDGSYMNVGELVEKHKAMNDELEEMKKKKDDDATESESGLEEKKKLVEVEGDDKAKDNDEEEEAGEKKEDDDDAEDPAEDEAAKKKALELAEHEESEIEAAKKKKNAAKAKAEKLRNAHLNFEPEETATVELMSDQIQRGKSRYGSN